MKHLKLIIILTILFTTILIVYNPLKSKEEEDYSIQDTIVFEDEPSFMEIDSLYFIKATKVTRTIDGEVTNDILYVLYYDSIATDVEYYHTNITQLLYSEEDLPLYMVKQHEGLNPTPFKF